MKIYLSFLVIFVAVECQLPPWHPGFLGQNFMSPHVPVPLLGQGQGQPQVNEVNGIPQQAPPANGGGFDYAQSLEEQNRKRCTSKWNCNYISQWPNWDPEVCCQIASIVNGHWDWQCISRSLSIPGRMTCK